MEEVFGKPVKPEGIFKNGSFNGFRIFFPVGFESFEDVADVGALVYGSPYRFRREERSVGFDENAFERNFRRRRVESFSVFIGEDSREAETYSGRYSQGFAGEVGIFAETVDYGIADAEFAKRIERGAAGISRMDDERKPVFQSEVRLQSERPTFRFDFLGLDGRIFGKTVKIPSGFSDGDDHAPFSFEESAEFFHFFVYSLERHFLGFARMETHGGAVFFRVALGEGDRLGARIEIATDLYGEGHSRFFHIGKEIVFPKGKFVEVGVGVRVDDHVGKCTFPTGFCKGRRLFDAYGGLW